MLKEFGLWTLVAIAIVVGLQFVLPVHFAYATSDSMAPTIDDGDAYLVIESATIERGDIITFRSAGQDDYVTHRVVQQTEDGFITQGDANPTTDQAAGTEPVSPRAVIGVVATVNGEPVSAPGIGPLLAFIDSHRFLVFLGAIGVVIADLVGDFMPSNRPKRRALYRIGDIAQPLIIGAFGLSLLFIGMSGTVYDATYVASTENTGAEQTIPVGEAATRTMTVDSAESPLTTVIMDADGMEIIDRTRDGSAMKLTLLIPAQDSIGPHETRIGFHRYPSTLPAGVLTALHDIHWLVAAFGSLFPIFGPIIAGYLLVYDGRAPIRTKRKRAKFTMGGGDR